MSNEQQSGKMWSGRFREPLDKEFEQWQRSIVFDWRLLDAGGCGQQGACVCACCRRNADRELRLQELRSALDAVAAEFGTSEGADAGAQPSDCRRHSSLCRACRWWSASARLG